MSPNLTTPLRRIQDKILYSVPSADATKKILNSAKNEIGEEFVSGILNKVPKELMENGVPKSEKASQLFTSGGMDFLELFLDPIYRGLGKIGKTNSRFYKWYSKHLSDEKIINAAKGVIELGSKAIDEAEKSGKDLAKIELTKHLNDAFSYNTGAYDTKKERFLTRIVSGITASIFLGNDFYNKAISRGKSDSDAKKSQHLKQGQELKENFTEGALQFAGLALLTKLTNQSIAATVLTTTGVSLIAKVVSRKMSGMKISRVKVPENSINEFEKSIKENRPYETQSEKDKKAKKPILNAKTILAFCGASIAAGYIIRFVQGKLFVGADNSKIKELGGFIKSKIIDKEFDKVTSTVATTKEDIDTVAKITRKTGQTAFADEILNLKNCEFDAQKGQLELGLTKSVTDVFGMKINKNKIRQAPLLPFQILKEIALYPFKLFDKLVGAIASDSFKANKDSAKILDGIKNSGLTGLSTKDKIRGFFTSEYKARVEKEFVFDKMLEEKNKAIAKNLNGTSVENIFLKYSDIKNKYSGNQAKIEEEFEKQLTNARLRSLDTRKASKNNNASIAVMAQLLSTITGIWFNMNDEFNAAIKNGEDKQEAGASARRRGIAKVARTTSQVAITGTLNEVFRRQYNSSLLKSSAVVLVCTILTDKVTRLLSAMPTRKMKNKEEIDQYQHDQKTGRMAWYFNGIEKLSH